MDGSSQRRGGRNAQQTLYEQDGREEQQNMTVSGRQRISIPGTRDLDEGARVGTGGGVCWLAYRAARVRCPARGVVSGQV